MMQWTKKCITVPQYEYTGANQYGARWKRTGYKRISVARLECKISDASEVQKLILLSDTLDVPVRYDYDNYVAYIEVISHEALKGCI